MMSKGVGIMKIAIVGAGQGGSNLIKSLSLLENMEITLVVDTNREAPGLKLAAEKNIPTADNISRIEVRMPDIIIEATGNQRVAEQLNELYKEHSTVVDSKAAVLITSLVEKNINTIEKIQEVSKSLIESSEKSTQYIKQSDTIIKYVNKIANQTKILGINASIESARAGEQGKGFSIVAGEVQKLAQDSENFAHEINTILQKLEVETNIVNSEVDKLEKLSNIK